MLRPWGRTRICIPNRCPSLWLKMRTMGANLAPGNAQLGKPCRLLQNKVHPLTTAGRDLGLESRCVRLLKLGGHARGSAGVPTANTLGLNGDAVLAGKQGRGVLAVLVDEPVLFVAAAQIGRASCRERVWGGAD